MDNYYKHLGIYAFRRTFLIDRYTKLKDSALEKAERLEQLAWLESGELIALVKTNYESVNIDQPTDLKKALAYLKRTTDA